MNKLSIDINQRIPLNVLEVALNTFLSGNYSNEYVIEQLRLEFDGENRLKKALRIVNKIIIKSPLKDFLLQNKEEILIALKKKEERNLILIALLNSAFPFSFFVLKTFGKYFSVQEEINSEIIKKAISNVYGGNRATENGIYSVVPMFLEANFFKRPSTGIYKFENKLNVSLNISKNIFIQSFLLNNGINDIEEFHYRDPYFNFITF
ncbi:hypothetical protein [Flavobacterium dankookense]|uniref:Uncharacterized protein n=1 Tax=Flavobacterium dankookense TaxID=706186 RepID=A0A4R6QGT1_9FLAO|nr:hypothetical protein [Flavobacterium dankookense]TDP61183.1 hypothetical protein BC748_0797 [Flavobacterium dankookense]